MQIYVVFVIFGCFCTTRANLLKATDWKDGIYPGTKWCGSGSTAKDYDDLGKRDKLDACCRAHDKCPIRIKALKSGYGLKNLLLYTRSACNCENDFHDCLKAVSGSHARNVGLIYFQLLHPRCIKLSHPKKCKKKFLGVCYKWKTDTSKTEYKWANGKYWVNLDIWEKIKDFFLTLLFVNYS